MYHERRVLALSYIRKLYFRNNLACGGGRAGETSPAFKDALSLSLHDIQDWLGQNEKGTGNSLLCSRGVILV